MGDCLEHEEKGLIEEAYGVGKYGVILRKEVELFFVFDKVEKTK